MSEEVVAQVEQDVLAVGGLAQREQPRPGREQTEDGGGIGDLGSVRDTGSHAAIFPARGRGSAAARRR